MGTSCPCGSFGIAEAHVAGLGLRPHLVVVTEVDATAVEEVEGSGSPYWVVELSPVS
jgi:hypothetical protein